MRQSRGLVATVCSNDSFFGVAESYDASGSYGSYSLEGCSATIVPVLGNSSGKANVSRYEELIACGFLLTWQVPYRFHRRPNCQVNSLRNWNIRVAYQLVLPCRLAFADDSS